MKPAEVAFLVVAGAGAAYLFVQWRKSREAVMAGTPALPASMTPGKTFVGPALPAATGVIGSKAGAAFVGPLPFMGPPAPDETVRVNTDYQETQFGWPL